MAETKKLIEKLPLPTIGARIKHAIETIKKARNGEEAKPGEPVAPH
jgi:hypothetical protein